MEAKELRMGNLVHGNPYNGLITVFSNNKCVIKHKSGIARFLIEDLEPIPLTEEWLLKFGFEIKQSRFGNEYLGKINLYTTSDKNIVFCYDGYLKGIKYVHQLQNLYFALTGK